MGVRRTYRCPSCGYSALVSGGADAGASVLTQTVTCAGCRSLHDVVTRRLWGPDASAVPIACEVDPSHAVTHWAAPGPCPRCGATMRETGGRHALWD